MNRMKMMMQQHWNETVLLLNNNEKHRMVSNIHCLKGGVLQTVSFLYL